MQFRDLKRQYQALKPQIDQAVVDVMAECNFISGKQVDDLEKHLAEYVGVKHCITCANGTDALELAERAYNIGKGDAVFVPDFTFFSTAETVADLGATPVFVDVEYDSFNISPEALEDEIKKVIAKGELKPRAVVPVDLFGQPANFEAIFEVAKKYDLLVIEDAAQGFGGRIGERRACSFGDIATTSFFPAKPLGCYGDGGAVFTNDDEIADIIRSLAVHGKSKTDKYENLSLGINSRLDTIQAAILDIKLTAFIDYELDGVNNAAHMYTERLKNVVEVPEVKDGYYSSWAQYTIKLKDRETRDRLQAELKEHGIPTMIYYPRGMHQQGAFKNIPYEGQCSNTEILCDRVLALPMHPYLTEEDIELVCGVIIKAL